MNNKELVGARIKELRKAKRINQEFLAEKLGIEPRQLSKLETGKNYPSFETTLSLLRELNITFEELIDTGHLRQKTVVQKEAVEMIKNLDGYQLKLVYKFLKAL